MPPAQPSRQINLTGKPHGLAPTSEGKIRANRLFARQDGVTPPYVATAHNKKAGADVSICTGGLTSSES